MQSGGCSLKRILLRSDRHTSLDAGEKHADGRLEPRYIEMRQIEVVAALNNILK